MARLETLRNGDGGWPWFPGGQSCDSGHARRSSPASAGCEPHGVAIDVQPALAALPWLDGRLVRSSAGPRGVEDPVLTPIGAFALYARSFFAADAPPQGAAAEAIRWGLDVGATSG